MEYSQPCFRFYSDLGIKISEGTQQGDPKSPALLSNSIQDLIDCLESKIYLWHLDDKNLGDDYRTVPKDFKGTPKSKTPIGIKTPNKDELFILGSPLDPKLLSDILEKNNGLEKLMELLNN